MMRNEGSLFVVVIGTIEGMQERNSTGLTVALGGGISVPIGHLTNNFITTQCATFAEKPKVFIFIDPDVVTNSTSSTDTSILVCTSLFLLILVLCFVFGALILFKKFWYGFIFN
jgi:hypothetical protein